MPKSILLCLGLAAAVLLGWREPCAGQPAVTIDGAITYQVIDGFGANINSFSWNGTDLQPVLDALVDQAGMTLFRVIYNEGWETNNDNGDPDVMNWDYYNQVYSGPLAEKLWGTIGYLNQRGITNGIMPNPQGRGPDWMVTWTNTLLPGNEAEWAEAITSLLLYGRNTRHLQFNLIAPQNEPDLGGEGIAVPTADQYLTMLRTLAAQLDTNGLSDVRVVGPDRSNSGTNWLPEMLNDPVIMSKLGHFGLHSYSPDGSGTWGVDDFLQASAYDRTFWITEFNVWCSSCEWGGAATNGWEYFRGTAEYLLHYLSNGASAGLVWEGYDSYYPHHGTWSFWGLFGADNPYAQPITYTPRKNFYTLSQITRFVRPGAKRIDVSGLTDPLYFLAFYHSDSGQLTLVGENTNSGPVVLGGVLTNLPAVPSLDLYYTDPDNNLYHSASFAVSNGAFAATVPANCVFTLVGFDPARTAVSVLITNPADGTFYSAPATIPIAASATTTVGSISSVSFFCGTTNLGETVSPPYSVTWSNVPPGKYTVSATATNSEGNYAVSPGVRFTVIGPADHIRVTPTNAAVVPYGTEQFTALVVDALGNPLITQPPVAWSVSGGGIIDSNGVFSAGSDLGGPFTVTASSGGLSGVTSIFVATNINYASAGGGYVWYSLTAATDSWPQAFAPAVNDGDVATDVELLLGGGEDGEDAFEAAGVLWPSARSIGRVVYFNGSYTSSSDGVFAANFGLQFSPDGFTWTNAGPAWTVTPTYVYNSPSSANASFTFTGPAATVYGVRCVGQVHTGNTNQNSWVACATEVEAFAALTPGPATQLTVSPTNATIIAWGTQQFTAMATDAFGTLLTPPPTFCWLASGGGMIDSNGLFTAFTSAGGPFTITASAAGISGSASISITTNLNVAPMGNGYTWYSLSSSTAGSPETPAPGINDGDLETDITLVPGGGEDQTNAYEAAGVVWPAAQTIDRVSYYNGSYTTAEEGVFTSNFGLQFSPDGSTWTNAGPAWTYSPAYIYDSSQSASTNFTFTGPAVTVRGIRCVGRVHTRRANSWLASATEVQAFAAPGLPVGPWITSQPTNQTVLTGATTAFTATATGAEPLNYQWQFNGTNLDGALGNTLSLTNVQPGQAGGYGVVVTNAAGSATSAVATLTVYSPAAITTQPTNVTAPVGATVQFSVTATGTAPLSYQWQFNSTNLDGAVADTLTISNAQPAQAGSYAVVVTNVAGSATSALATLTLIMPPAITVQPTNQAVLAGATVGFTVAASGAEPVIYQWLFNGTNLSGATAVTLTLTNVQSEQGGAYRAEVTNPGGTTNTELATLTVLHWPVLKAPRMTVDAAFAFTLSGDAGFNYRIEASSNLTGWSVLATVTNMTGEAEFTDTTSSNSCSRFYRARLAY